MTSTPTTDYTRVPRPDSAEPVTFRSLALAHTAGRDSVVCHQRQPRSRGRETWQRNSKTWPAGIELRCGHKEHPSQRGGHGAIRQLRIRRRAQRRRRRYWHYLTKYQRSKSPSRQALFGVPSRFASATTSWDDGTSERRSNKRVRTAHPSSMQRSCSFSGAMVALGMSQADDLVDDAREALRAR